MKVKCQKCKGLIKDCPDCKNLKDTFYQLHEEAKKSATYKGEIHFIEVHDIISKLEQENKALKEKVEKLEALVKDAFYMNPSESQFFDIRDKLKALEEVEMKTLKLNDQQLREVKVSIHERIATLEDNQNKMPKYPVPGMNWHSEEISILKEILEKV